MDHTNFVITVRAEPHSAPAIVRLRGFLKTALRAFHLRCVAIAPEPAEELNRELAEAAADDSQYAEFCRWIEADGWRPSREAAR